jgi:hypothetical protein
MHVIKSLQKYPEGLLIDVQILLMQRQYQFDIRFSVIVRGCKLNCVKVHK